MNDLTTEPKRDWPTSVPTSDNITWNFSGKTVVITGAGRSQGREHAQCFARAGANVVALDRCTPSDIVPWGLSTEEDLAETIRTCKELGVESLAIKADVRDSYAVQEAMQKVVETFGGVDILVNNAAVYPFASVEMDQAFWDEVLDTNLKGAFLCSRAVAPYMKEARGGKIISTGSSATVLSLGHQTSYAASKHGLLGFTRALAIDLAPYGVNVNVVSPGSVHTPHAMNYFDAYLDDLAKSATPEDPPGAFQDVIGIGGAWSLFGDEVTHPRDISHAIMFLASDAARYITGQNLLVDQGFSIK